MSLEKQCGTHTHTHRIRAQKDTVLPDGIPDHIHIQSNMTLKTVVSVIPLVYVKKKKRKKEKKKSVWVALKRKWRGNGQKKRSM